MLNRKIKFPFWFTALVLVMACVPTFSSAPPLPTLDPGAINTFIAQTANAASSQTAAVMPASTSTETLTATPQNTDTPEPTATNTVIFILSTPTPFVIPTFTGISDVTGQKNYACAPISVTPVNGTRYDPRVEFDAIWRVKNTGKREWDRKDTDYIYDSGDKLHLISGYDISETVLVGQNIDIIVDMEAPKNPGTYTTFWTLKRNEAEFCKVSLTIVVRVQPVEPSATATP